MNMTSQKRLAAQVMGVGEKRVWFDESKLAEIKEAITKADIRSLIIKGYIGMRPVKGISRARANIRRSQKIKGRQVGQGSRKGKFGARNYKKREWMNKIRLMRSFLKELKDGNMLEGPVYRELYLKAKGGYFRSKRHLKLHINEHHLIKKPAPSK